MVWLPLAVRPDLDSVLHKALRVLLMQVEFVRRAATPDQQIFTSGRQRQRQWQPKSHGPGELWLAGRRSWFMARGSWLRKFEKVQPDRDRRQSTEYGYRSIRYILVPTARRRPTQAAPGGCKGDLWRSPPQGPGWGLVTSPIWHSGPAT